MMPPLHLAFEDNITVDERTLHLLNIGELVLTSGKVVASDPMLYEKLPFTRRIEPGRYPIILSVAHYKTDQRIGFARLQIQPTIIPLRWELATREKAPYDNRDDGYGVDFGLASFMDAKTFDLWEKKVSDETIYSAIIEELAKTYVNTWEWGNFVQDTTTGANVLVFSSGHGDGYFRSYWGLSEADEIVALVTDFNVIR